MTLDGIQGSVSGNPMAIDIAEPENQPIKMRFRSVTLNSDNVIQFNESITVLVGPNNVGKSQLLNNLGTWSGGHTSHAYPICTAIHFEQEEDVHSVIRWCQTNLPVREPGPYEPNMGRQFLGAGGTLFPEQHIYQTWAQGTGFTVNPQLFCLYLRADDRANLTQARPGFHFIREQPQFALQRIWKYEELEQQLSSLVLEAFDDPVTVNRESTSSITLHLGKPTASRINSRTAYIAQIEGLPEVHDQGHGLRSFVGMLMEIIAGNHLILLIDEPEAFLHPPQARLFGRVLAQLRKPGMQIIVSTHSTDILQGLVTGQSTSEALTIVRLTRDVKQNVNYASQITPEAISEIAKDPLLRHSSILEGLFYHGTVLCESDGDATFYSAVSGSIGKRSERAERSLDLLFTHTNGGYSRFPGAVRALAAAGVPVVSVVDMDILGNQTGLKELTLAHGHSFDQLGVTSDLNTITSFVTQKATDPNRKEVRSVLLPILDKQERHISASETATMRQQLGGRSGWQEVKLHGTNFFRGQERVAVDRILSTLKAIGVFVVPVGELETFNQAVSPAPKGEWLNRVLAEGFEDSPGHHQEFVAAIRSFIASRQDRRAEPPISPE